MDDSTGAFYQAYMRLSPPIRAKCRRLLGSSAEAEDVVQETFVRLWQAGPPLPPVGDTRSVMAWLYRTSMHLGIDALRRRRRRALEPIEGEPSVSLPCALSLESLLHARHLIATLCERVPDDELQAVVLCRIDGLGHVEAAEVLGTSERTLRRLLARFDERGARYRQEVVS